MVGSCLFPLQSTILFLLGDIEENEEVYLLFTLNLIIQLNGSIYLTLWHKHLASFNP